ncbi:MAG: 30S ribosomal protein S2 [Planctomycetes bacterium]|nr:30S ribosomal protein S2 [Planctomycetota bacterium]
MAKLYPFLKKLSVRELLKAGIHFGHKVSNMHPKMLPFIHSKKNSVHIIDIRKTIKGIIEAAYYLVEMSKLNKQLLILGTKKQLKSLVENEGKRAGIPYVAERWPGGLLTNYTTIKGSVKRLEQINNLEESGQIEKLTKKEKSLIQRDKKRLLRNLGGILTLTKLPDVVIIIDPGLEYTAVREAKKIGATVIGLIDTDTDPTGIDISIPCNDDSMNAVNKIVTVLVDAILYGKKDIAPENKEQVATEATA